MCVYVCVNALVAGKNFVQDLCQIYLYLVFYKMSISGGIHVKYTSYKRQDSDESCIWLARIF